MTHVVHGIASVGQRDGGPTTVVRSLLRHSAGSGVRMSVVTTPRGLGDREDIPRDTVVCRNYPPHRLTFSPSFSGAFRRQLASADLAHVHGLFNFPSAMSIREATKAGVPYILQPHGVLDAYHMGQRTALKHVWSKVVEREAVERAAAVVVSSSREAAGVQAYAPGARLFTLPLGVDDDLFRVAWHPAERPTILFLGRLAEKKGLDILLTALRSPGVRAHNADVVLAGPTHRDLPRSVRQSLEDEQRAGNLRLIGAVDATARKELLRRSSVFVLPSRDESFGIAAAEALAVGVPVVMSRHVGIADELEGAGAGIVTTLEADSLAAGLEAVLDNSDAAASMASRGRDFAAQNFHWPVIWDKYESLCRSLV